MSDNKRFLEELTDKVDEQVKLSKGGSNVVKSFFTDRRDEQNEARAVGKRVKEAKNMALHIMLKPSTYLILQKLSEKEGTSKNEVVNRMLDLFAEKI
ncbi:MAG: hypothetical protein Nk1A_6780 [Endomicrobiia bacterium]|nr:MAG: hypothetical protein Nk1A_6780 [Endomicrobiia bacterium]